MSRSPPPLHRRAPGELAVGTLPEEMLAVAEPVATNAGLQEPEVLEAFDRFANAISEALADKRQIDELVRVRGIICGSRPQATTTHACTHNDAAT